LNLSRRYHPTGGSSPVVTIFFNKIVWFSWISLLKKESLSIGTLMKFATDIIGGPAGVLNNISCTAALYFDDVGLISLT
jgi:hypothetical protein